MGVSEDLWEFWRPLEAGAFGSLRTPPRPHAGHIRMALSVLSLSDTDSHPVGVAHLCLSYSSYSDGDARGGWNMVVGLFLDGPIWKCVVKSVPVKVTQRGGGGLGGPRGSIFFSGWVRALESPWPIWSHPYGFWGLVLPCAIPRPASWISHPPGNMGTEPHEGRCPGRPQAHAASEAPLRFCTRRQMSRAPRGSCRVGGPPELRRSLGPGGCWARACIVRSHLSWRSSSSSSRKRRDVVAQPLRRQQVRHVVWLLLVQVL